MIEILAPYKETADAVVKHFATQSAVARVLGYEDLRNVTPWTTGKRQFPPEHCVTIERESGGVITCEYLNPEQQWLRVKDKAWPHPSGRPVIDHAAKQGA